MSEQQFINYYRCPYDGEEWADIWSCCCNDRCPKCGIKDIEPYRSEEVVSTVSDSGNERGCRTPNEWPRSGVN